MHFQYFAKISKQYELTCCNIPSVLLVITLSPTLYKVNANRALLGDKLIKLKQ